jgi:aminoglycoside phosphotransferase (APT) family kinase protein
MLLSQYATFLKEESAAPHYDEFAQNISMKIGRPAKNLSRFPIGHDNFVYDVEDLNGDQYVIRLSPTGKEKRTLNSLYWYDKLEPLNIFLPKILSYDTSGNIYLLVLERIPGTDLGNVYRNLTLSQKKDIAQTLATIQDKVQSLPPARGYGFASSYEDPNLLPTWKEVIQKMITDREMEIVKAGTFDPKYVRLVREKLDEFDAYFAQVMPRPFLNDTSIKNVLVHNGKLSGIVDIDEICFGDQVLVLGLTRMALLSRNLPTDYIDIWTEASNLNADQKRALSLYTLIFCLDLMRKVGQIFDNYVDGNIYRPNIPLYISLFDMIYTELSTNNSHQSFIEHA